MQPLLLRERSPAWRLGSCLATLTPPGCARADFEYKWHGVMIKASYVNPPGAAPAQGLYSHAGFARRGIPVFIAGQLAVGADGSVVGKADFTAQFHQVFRNLGNVLEGLGAGFDSILKFTTYMVHSQDLESFMALRRELFPKLFVGPDYPPNTLLIIDRLVREEFLIEVEAIAAVEG
jgi:enamine deaminase RidA (YjgF/YER057c/UK114 family)